MRILVAGAGARQHALAWRLGGEPGVERVIVIPGNPLMADVAEVRDDVVLEDLGAVVELALSERVDLVAVGPEDPLVEGLSDRLAAAGVPCFGPSAAAARLEASKAFARSVCDASGIAMARGRAFDEPAAAVAYAESLGGPVVVKADGLAGGKGVTPCPTVADAEQAVREALVVGRFGAAGRTVVVEQFLAGVEASVMALCDGRGYALLPAARDHKRLGDGDTGPNTGGMGAYSPVPEVDDARLEALGEAVIAPVLREMDARGTPFRGALFAGVMLTADGPRVLEYNVRLGDPETQAVLPRLDVALAPLLLECATGSLSRRGVLPTGPEATVALFLAAAGYPDGAASGKVIEGIEEARRAGALVFGAGIARTDDGGFVTAGGRVLTVVGRGADVVAAADAAYAAAALIQYEGKFARRDIGRAPVAAAGVSA